MVPLAPSFTGEPLLNPFLGPEQSSIQKGNTDLIKAQSAIIREREKEMKKGISMYRVPLATGHCIYIISFGSHSNFYSQIDIIIPCGPWDRSLGSQIIWSGLKTGRKQSQDSKLQSNSWIFASLLLSTTVSSISDPNPCGQVTLYSCPKRFTKREFINSLWAMSSSYIGFALENKLQRFDLNFRASGLPLHF